MNGRVRGVWCDRGRGRRLLPLSRSSSAAVARRFRGAAAGSSGVRLPYPVPNGHGVRCDHWGVALPRQSSFARTLKYVPEGGQMLLARGAFAVPLIIAAGIVASQVVLGLAIAALVAAVLVRVYLVGARARHRAED